MEKIYNFYVLSASSDAENIRYVGVTVKTVKQRFYSHKYCAIHPEKRGLPVHKWMYSHYEKGDDIIVKQIDSCREKEWEDREKYWISYYKNLGFNLLNISEGGKGVVTLEMREKDSIERSVESHKKSVVALYKDGTFYKEYDSITEATVDLQIKSKSAIGNALKGRSKSAGGYLWVYKEDYKPNNKYIYSPREGKRKKVYQFDIDGFLINEYPSLRYFDSLNGWSMNGVRSAIKNKSLYHDCYWALSDKILLDEYEPLFYYQETDNKGDIVNYYRTQTEIVSKFNLSASNVCIRIKEKKEFPNGNIISKL